MCPIQFQFLVAYMDLPNGILYSKLEKQLW